jgi:2-polyprenyl-6-methoxyphenol hydroxylase-like FAD-dependent oxidoreductase
MTTLTTRCCIDGGGPAGMMLGLLLARAGVDVIVLEKHADFLRDFRGDTIHPSTLEVMHELGLVDELLAPPHQEIRELTGMVGGERIRPAEFGHLPCTVRSSSCCRNGTFSTSSHATRNTIQALRCA